ncbi:hypothetical protein Barb6XT_01175 [Bacteroidales bacterium Barb6XT]|nr:hypothetical protein Barb6XT_01175 [Bacteroidales bacterium Barb6XT]
MKRRFNLLLTALLLFAATGNVWATAYKAGYKADGTFILSTNLKTAEDAAFVVDVTGSATEPSTHNLSGNATVELILAKLESGGSPEAVYVYENTTGGKLSTASALKLAGVRVFASGGETLVIPEEITPAGGSDAAKVTAIAGNALDYLTKTSFTKADITTLTISAAGLTRIEANTFKGLTGLTATGLDISVAVALASIGDSAFAWAGSVAGDLTAITLPEFTASVTIQSGAFSGIGFDSGNGIEFADVSAIDNAKVIIKEGAFANTVVTGSTIADAKIDFANSATGAFSGADIDGTPNLATVVSTNIGTAFAGATFSDSSPITLPATIKTGAFKGTTFATAPTITNAAGTIGNNAFENAIINSSSTINIPAATTSIGTAAFKGASANLTINLAGAIGLTEIKADAFDTNGTSKPKVAGLIGTNHLFDVTATGLIVDKYSGGDSITIKGAKYTGEVHTAPALTFTSSRAIPSTVKWAAGVAPKDSAAYGKAFNVTFGGSYAGLDGLLNDHIGYTIDKADFTAVKWDDAVILASDTSVSNRQSVLEKLIIGRLGSYTLVQGADKDYTVTFSPTAIEYPIAGELAFEATITSTDGNFTDTAIPSVYIVVREGRIDIGSSAVTWEETPFVLEENASKESELLKVIIGTVNAGAKTDTLKVNTYYTVTFSDVEDGKVIATITAIGSKFTGKKIITIEVRSSAVHIGGGAIEWTENAFINEKALVEVFSTDRDTLYTAFKGVYGTVTLVKKVDYVIDTAIYAKDKVTVTVKAVKGTKYTGSKDIVITITTKLPLVEETDVLKPNTTGKYDVLEIKEGAAKLPKGLADLDEVYEIKLPASITHIEAGSFPNAARIGKGINITALADIAGTSESQSRKLVIAKDAFAGQTLIVDAGRVLTLDTIGAGAFAGAKFISTDGKTPVIKFSGHVKELPAGILAGASGVILDLSDNGTLQKADATTLAGFAPHNIKGLFNTTVNGNPTKGLFDVKLGNRKPEAASLKAATVYDNEAKGAEDKDGIESLRLTSVYSNNRQEVHFAIKNALDQQLEDKKDYDVTVEGENEEVADLNSLIDAGIYTLGLRFKGYEGFDEALADGRITFEIKKYPLGGTASLLPADRVDGIKVDPVQFVEGNVPFLYTGKAVKPVPDEEFTVKDDFNSTLVFGKDYELTIGDDGKVNAYDLSVEAGKKTVKIKAAADGNYTGEYTLPYNVGRRPLSDLEIKVANRYFNTKTGDAVKITPDDISATLNGETIKLVNRTDYRFTGAGATNEGISFKGLGDHPITLEARRDVPDLNFEGDYKANVTLVENNIRSAVVSVMKEKSYTYTGEPIDVTTGSLKLREDLKAGVDYEVVYSPDDRTNATKAGTGITVYVQGIGIWGEKDPVGTFAIVAEKFEKLSIDVDENYTLKYAEDPNDALASIKETVKVSLNGVELPIKDFFDVKTGLSTKRDKVTVEVTPATSNKNFTAGTATKTVNILNYTGNEAVTASAASVSYANGILTLTNLDGATATIVSLNGKTAARFAVSGSDVRKAVALAPGFYILSAGKTVSKFIVR